MTNILEKFLKKIKFKIKENIRIKNELQLLKNIFINLCENLNRLYLLNFYKEFNHHYLMIFDKMNKLKLFIYKLETKKNKYYEIIKLRKEILNILNLICPTTIKKILKVYLSLENLNNSILFSNSEREELEFYIKFVIPVCIWDSEYHNKLVNLNNYENKLIIINPDNFNFNISNENSNNHENIKISNIFDLNECKLLLNYKNIYIEKNKKSISLLENKNGCSIYIKLKDKFIVIQGFFIDDILDLASTNIYASAIINYKLNNIKSNLYYIPESFYLKYFNILSLRDKIICSYKQLSEEIKKKYNDFKNIKLKTLMLLINEFLLSSKYRKIDILTFLLISDQEDQKLAYILFDIFKTKDKKNLVIDIYNSLHYSIRNNIDIAKLNVESDEKEVLNINESDIPYERRINLLQAPIDIKMKAVEKLKAIKNNFQGDLKAQTWLDGLLRIPFNIYSKNEIISFKKDFIANLKINTCSEIEIEDNIKDNTNLLNEWNNYKKNRIDYLINVRKILDNSVYGLKETKKQLERIFAQWINGEMKGAVLGLCGPPGTGKTSLIKNGLSKCLKDNSGISRPFAFLPIGGSVNGSILVGHNYTYVGSTWGRIVDILMTSKCMNPIIFIDELDKVSNTENGHEIISVLTHLTDSTQNDEFEDKFFAGVKLDLSKALIIFSFNDINLIDHILKDRITIIETYPLKIEEKIIIIKNYLLPEILKEVGFEVNEILILDETIKYLIESYTLEAGVRKIKEKITEIIREINLERYYSNDIKLPYLITIEYCNKLFENKNKIKLKKRLNSSHIGIVNGLYASSLGIGGITYIQAIKFPSNKNFELNITGTLGDSMKESVQYSLNLVLNKLNINEDKFGIHIHCPDAAVKKDGPSAGISITTAIYSLLTNKEVNNKVAMTGEIDLLGNITAIGGLEAKLLGAKSADIEKVLIPFENLEDLNIINLNYNIENENFKIILVKNFDDVINILFN